MVGLTIGAVALGACFADVTTPGTDRQYGALAVTGDSVVVLSDSTSLVIETPAGGPSRVRWKSSDTAVASVDERGTVRGWRVGQVTITGSVSAPELAHDIEMAWPMTVVFGSLAINPPDSLTGLGESRTLVAWGTNVRGVPNVAVPATFTTLDTGIVAITAGGIVTARANGMARVVASYNGLTNTVHVCVHRVAKSVTFTTSALALPALQRDTVVSVRVRDTRDSLFASPVIEWNSSDPSAISVSESGTIRALRVASGVITARVDTVVAQLAVSVAQVATNLSIAAGDGQVRTAGTPVALPPTVLVRDVNDNPIAGVSVVFGATSGGGRVTDSVQVTNNLGLATPGSWTLGSVPGPNTLLASAGGIVVLFHATGVTGPVSAAGSQITVTQGTVVAGGATTLRLQAGDQFGNPIASGGLTVTFNASGGTSMGQIGPTVDHGDGTYTAAFTGVTAGTPITIGATINITVVTSPLPTVTVVAGVPVRLSVTAGDAQQAAAGTALPVRPTVVAYDQLDNPVPNLAVTFGVTAGGGSVTGGAQTTDATGAARLGAWTLGTVSGVNQLNIAAAGLGATITAIGIAGPAVGANSQVAVSAATVVAGGTVTLTLQARDRYGNALTTGGQIVTFPTSGGSSTGQLSATSDNGDGTYSATFSAMSAGTATTIGATIDGIPVTSTLPTVTVVAGTPAQLTVVAGADQQASAGSRVSVTPVVGVYDALGNPLSGIAVTFAVTAGGGSISGSTSQSTDGAGRAAVMGWTLGTTAGENHLTVSAQSLSVTIVASGVPGPASFAMSVIVVSDDTVVAGSAVSLMLQTRDQYGNPLTSGGRTVVFSATGGTSTGTISPTTDDADGRYVATFSGLIAGSPTTIRATINGAAVTSPGAALSVAAGPPASFLILAGNNQAVQVGRLVPVAPSLRVRDAQGNVVAGASVVFAAASGSGSVTGGFQVSDAAGLVTVAAWTLGTQAGTQILTASAGGAFAQFVATATPGPLSLSGTMITVSANTVASGSTITLRLQTADEYGNPIPLTGRSVRFAHSGGTSVGAIAGTQSQGGGLYTAGFTGDRAGSATTITATVDAADVTSPSPTVTVTAGPPASMARWAGHNQTVAAGAMAPIAPAVFIKDAKNNPVPGVSVTFSIMAGNGQVSGPVAVTDANGVATVGAWTVGTLAGAVNTLRAVGGGYSVDFAAAVVAGSASSATSVITVDKDSVEVAHGAKVTLYTKDAYGNALSSGGYTVSFFYEGGTSVGTFQVTADKGDGRYEAQFVGQIAGTWGQIRATLNGVLVMTTPPRMRVWQ